jgi:hypothetical protein
MYKFYRKLASGKWKYSETFKSTIDPYYHELINYCNDNKEGVIDWKLVRDFDKKIMYSNCNELINTIDK